MDLAVAALAFGTIFVVELPDKTFIATLVLSTRYRPLLVWVGVALAFAVQTALAVALGSVAGLLPGTVVGTVAMLLFLGGGILLLREARGGGDAAQKSRETEETEEAEEAEIAARARGTSGLRAVVTSFSVLFAAEWGDLSQLLTLTLVTRYDDPLSVFVGAWTALVTVSGLAVLVGRTLRRRVPVRALYAAGGTVCLVLAGVTAWELLA